MRMPSDFIRPVPAPELSGIDFATKYKIIQARVKYADGAPFLLTTETSLAELNSRMRHRISMNRYGSTSQCWI